MSFRAVRLGVLLSALTAAVPAHAWIERTVKSDAATVDVERSGAAVVTHEILLAVRGGPLSDYVIEPVDADAELLPEPTVTIAGSGAGAGLSIPLTASKEGTRVTLHVERERGLRTGAYQFRFQYRTDLRASGKVQPGAEGVVIRWSGPSFGDGIDAARVVFRLDRAERAPRLLGAASGFGSADTASITDDRNGVFLATARRSENKDEIEIVRPHVTRGEAVSWNVVADPAALDVREALAPAPEPAERRVVPTLEPAQKAPPRAPLWLLALLAASVSALYALLVFCKARWAADACRRFRATPRTLIPVHAGVRTALSGFGVLGGIAGAVFEQPWPAAASILVAFLAATHLPPSPSAPLRGPGSWARLDAVRVFAKVASFSSAKGRVFDAGTPLGFILFFSLIAAFAAGALFVGRTSPYLGVATALASCLLFPVFCTGREDEHAHARKSLTSLEWIFESLSRVKSLTVEVVGRIPLGGDTPDELRLEVVPRNPAPGFVALEVGFDAHESALGVLPLPFVIVRVEDASKAAECLQKGLLWTRGRVPEERVVVLRPKLPTRALCRDLARDLALRFTAAVDPRQPSRSAARSGGKASATSKAATTSSPAHAT